MEKEVGTKSYEKYSSYVKENIGNETIGKSEIFNEMFENLKEEDIRIIRNKQKRLNKALLTALNINKNYIFILLFTLGSILYLISKDVRKDIMILSIVAILAGLLFKTYEYLNNKFCYIDAQIIIIYKTVLDKIIFLRIKSRNANKDNDIKNR